MLLLLGLPTLLPSGLPTLLGSLVKKFLLPLVRALVAVWSLTQLSKPPTGLGLHNSLERLFEWFPNPL